MADTPNGSNSSRLEKIARSEFAAGVQRIAVILGTPLFIAALSWIGWTLVGIPEQISTLRGTINTRAAELQGTIDRVGEKVDGLDHRVDRLELWRDTQKVVR